MLTHAVADGSIEEVAVEATAAIEAGERGRGVEHHQLPLGDHVGDGKGARLEPQRGLGPVLRACNHDEKRVVRAPALEIVRDGLGDRTRAVEQLDDMFAGDAAVDDTLVFVNHGKRLPEMAVTSRVRPNGVSRKTGMLALAIWMVAAAGATAQTLRPVTVDDLMRVRTIVDAKVSPSGDRVAYVVSTPSVEKNVQETALFVVSVRGRDAACGSPRTARSLRRHCRRRGFAGRRTDARSRSSAWPAIARRSLPCPPLEVPSRALTTAPMGVGGYDWSPDGARLAFLSREPSTPGTVVRAGTPDPPTRLWVQPVDGDAKAVTPRDQYVDGFSWAPDGKEIAYSAAPVTGFSPPTRRGSTPSTSPKGSSGRSSTATG